MRIASWLLCLWLCCALTGRSWGEESKKYIQNSQIDIGNIVVTATKTQHAIKDVPVDTLVVTSQDIKASGAKNLVEVLNQVPGIVTDVHDDVFGTYTWRATMQGLSFNDGYALVLVDGKRMVGAGQSGGMGEYGIGLNQIPVSMVERIEVVQGPGSVLYGSDAVTGVINIITKQPVKGVNAGVGGSYGWYNVTSRRKNGRQVRPSDHGHWRNTEDVNAFFSQTPTDSISYYLGYNYERAEDIRQDPIGSYRHSALARVRWAPMDRLTMKLGGLVNHYEKSGYRDEDTWRLDLDSILEIDDAQRLTLRSYVYKWDFEHGFPGYPYGYKYGHQEHRQLELQYDVNIIDAHLISIGTEYREQLLDYQIENKGYDIPVVKGIYTSSVFVQDQFTPWDSLVLVPGARFEHHSEFGDELNPKFSLMYHLANGLVFRASIGRAFKSPTIRQLYYGAPYEHGTFFIKSNPNLDAETSWGYSASLQKAVCNNRLLAWISFFRNDIDELVARVDTGLEYMGKPLLTYENVKKARTQGIELQLKGTLTSSLSLGLAYTYTESEDRSNGHDLPYVPSHHCVVSARYTLGGSGIEIASKFTYTGRQYTNSSNTKMISDHGTVDLQVFKHLARQKMRLGVIAENVLGSRRGDEGNFRLGRCYLVKIEASF